MLCICEKCNKFKLWFEMAGLASTCKKCAEELHAKIDAKIKKAFGI